MLLWIVTAGAGVYLLAAGRPPRDSATSPGATGAPAAEPVPAGRSAQAGVPQAAAAAYAAGAAVPPIAHTRIATQPGQHPLLEFMHPALGIVGLGCWMAYVATKFGTFAWVSFGALVATIAAGLTWYTVNRRAAASRRAGAPDDRGRPGGTGGAARRYPPRRIVIHGSAAGVTLLLALITALTAAHG